MEVFDMKKTIILLLCLVLSFFIFGCGVENKQINGCSDEFSKDVYVILDGFNEDCKRLNINNKKDIYVGDNSVGANFINKYNAWELNEKEQEIYKIVSDSIFKTYVYLDNAIHGDIEFDERKYLDILINSTIDIEHSLE